MVKGGSERAEAEDVQKAKRYGRIRVYLNKILGSESTVPHDAPSVISPGDRFYLSGKVSRWKGRRRSSDAVRIIMHCLASKLVV